MGSPSKQARNVAIAKAFLDGRTLASLAAEHGVCLTRIHYIVRGQGVRLGRDAIAKRISGRGKPLGRGHADNIRKALLRRSAEGKRNGREPIFANDPIKREQYLDLRNAMGAAYARQAMGLEAL
jgi:hypothetical protein